jgi:hypothetical protein
MSSKITESKHGSQASHSPQPPHEPPHESPQLGPHESHDAIGAMSACMPHPHEPPP